MNDVPSSNFLEEALNIAQKALDEERKKVFGENHDVDDLVQKGWLGKRCSFRGPDGFAYLSLEHGPTNNFDFLKTLDGGKTWSRLVNLGNSAQIEAKRKQELETELKAVVNSCSTTKQLKERLPEFAKYIPDDSGSSAASNRSTAITVVNVAQKFRDAGWPRLQT